MKYGPDGLVDPLKLVIKQTPTSGTFAETKIVKDYSSGDDSCISTDIPISLILSLSAIFEYVILDQLTVKK